MSSPALLVIEFGGNRITLRRHSSYPPARIGLSILEQFESAQTIKPREHLHTGSWLLRLLLNQGDCGGTSLPTYEVYGIDKDEPGDWERAFFFVCQPSDGWKIGIYEGCDGEPPDDLRGAVRWYSLAAYRKWAVDEVARLDAVEQSKLEVALAGLSQNAGLPTLLNV